MKYNLNAESINYIKITYKDVDGFSHCIKTSVKRIDSIDILTCIKLDSKLFIKTPQEVELGIASDNGLYKAASTLKYIDWQDPYEFLAVKIPEDMEYRQNREYFRVKLAEDTELCYLKNETDEFKIKCKTYDISAKGVRLELDSDINLPEDVQIIIHFFERDLCAQAKYIRSDDEDGIVKASFEFENMNSQDLDFISQICFKKQLEAKRKTLM